MSARKTVHMLMKGEKPHVAGFGVLLRVEDEEEQTDGGIIIQAADEADKRGACRGIVEQIGPLAGRDPGDKPENWGAQVGNIVYFDRYQGAYFAVESSPRRYIVIQEKDIQLYVDPKETE
jgi:co-chaperonin GroES (HSP10)